MKKPTILKIAILLLLFLQADIVFSQKYTDFVRVYNTQLKGDIINIGNNILNRGTKKSDGTYSVSPNTPFSGTTSNDTNGNFDMYYVNVDPIPNSKVVFSSSSATLTVPNNNAPAAPCYKVAYAALYWSGILRSPADRTTIKNVKIKVPNTANSNYQDVTGTVIWDIKNNADGIADSGGNKTQAYACYAEITSLLNSTNANGLYTVANVQATEGVKNTNGSTGLAAGWSLFVVYEDNSLPTKSVSTFNGFFGIGSNALPVTTKVSGFTTPDLGDVNARVAFSALEGDQNYSGDYLYINGLPIVTTPSTVRPTNNFFKSSITTSTGVFTDRNPNGTNTLGFDAGVLDITPQSGIIKNKATSADITIGTNVDVYINYFLAFSVDVIAPNIKLLKTVEDAADKDASNANVTLGQELRYTLKFKNEGNDSATEFTITDQLPVNTNFSFPADIFKLPTGMTVANNVTYNAATRTLVFTVPNSLVEKFDPQETIRFKVHVVDDCASLTDACNNIIKNSAMSSYRGNPGAGGGGNGTLFGDKSYADANSCNATPQSTNFLVGLDACKNRKEEICLSEMEISASGGYDSYKWATSSAYNPVLGTNQKLKITGPGTYYVYSKKAGCPDFEEIITVKDGGGVKTNPIITYADNKDASGNIPGCDIDGKPLPKIFLCGANDSRLFNLNLPSATIVWEKTTCVRPPVADLSELCADERTSCVWTSAGANGSLFTVTDAGYYRVTISSGGCVNRFYFNVYKSDVAINETHKNILCTTPGSITVDKLTGYEFSLTHVLIPASSSTTTAWGDNNVFSITTAGNYVVNYRLKNVNPTCTYKTAQIIIAKDDFTAAIDNLTENPLCFGDLGRLQVSATSGFTGYYYTLYQDGVVVQQLGPLPDRTHAFEGLTPGKTYLVEVFTKKPDQTVECIASVSKLIPNPAAALSVTSSVIKPLTACADGQYRITASGGKAPYAFFVDGSTTEYALDENGNTDLNSIILNTPTAKEYTILVRDSNLCTTTYKFTVAANPKPVYTITPSVIKCYGEKGSITVNVTNPNGYTLEYSLDGTNFTSNPTFLDLKAGTYNVVVRYTLSGTTCTDPAQAVTILPPANALTASGGVAELAGCTLSGQGGKLRFTNVTGGKTPYEYSFDGGGSWQTSPEKDVLNGTYILIVRDAAGCTYQLPYDVILDPKPADPRVDLAPVVYNCNGTGQTTATVTNPSSGNYSYEYYLDGVANTPITNNVFNNILSGSHKIKVVYKLEDATTYSNLLKEDFGHGDPTTSPGIAAAYCFNNQDVNIHTCPNPTRSVEDNQYSVASFFWRGDTAWYPFKDHTSNGAVADGRYLLVNIGSAAGDYGILYSKPIADVIPNQPVKVDLAVANLLNAGVNGAAPIVRFELVNPAGVVVARVDTGKIAEAANDPNRTKWIEIPTISLNPGNNTNLTFVIRSGSLEYNGNDLLIDDISVYQLPKSCLAEQEIPFVVGTDKAFTVLDPTIQDVACNGGNTGSITITAQNFNTATGFYYSINGGTLQNATSSPVTVGGLTAGAYTVVVQSDIAGTCSKSFSKTIGSPTAVTVTASVTTQPTCTSKATITAVASGGTTPYKYELRAANGTTVITAFQDSGVFTGLVTGTYTIVAKDLRDCPSAVSTAVIVNDPTPVTASLASSSDLCFDADKATIVVTASGTGTLTYSLDGAAAVNTNTFTNVGVGTHSVLVTDSNNCTFTVTGIIVAPELKGSATVSAGLSCITTGATIKVDITGGKSTFTYKVKVGTGSYGSSVNVTGSTFNYPAAGAGDYTFEITDSNNPTACKAYVSITVNAITNPTVSATPVQVACNGASTGEVTLAGSGGSLSYTYSFNNSAFTTTTTYTGLKAGISYPYQVKDSKGCTSAIGNITLTEPTAVGGTISATDIKCAVSGTTPAVVTISGTGGTGAYTYSFNGTSNFTTTNTYSTSTAGAVTAYVKDANGCQAGPFSITIGTLDQITGINLVDSGYDCSTTPPGGHVTLTAVKAGTLANISYKITAGPAGYSTASNTTGDFKGLTPGLYTFQATDSKTLCTFSISYDVKGTSDIVAGGSVLTAIKCYAGTGTIQFTVTGAKTSGYDYIIKNAGGTTIQQANNVAASTTTINVASAVVAGDYTITATDRLTKCKAVYTVTLTQPASALDVTASAPNINCNNDKAIITAVGTGGTTSYSYAVVVKGAAAPTAFGTDPKLTVNTVNGTVMQWDVYIKDANGCTDFVTVTILKDQIPSVTATLDNQCTGSGNKFRITATGTGGVGTLQYGINGVGGAFTTDNFFDVVASATPYIVWVKDANGCTAQAAAITVYPQLTATTAVKELDCSASTPDATITVTANGGKTAYKYEVSTNGGTTYTLMASNVYTTATAGTFLIKVTDANGCTFVTTTDILSISNPTLTANQVNVSCNGGTDGSVQLIGAGGSLTGGQNYQYSKYGIIYGSASSFTGLAAGDYDFFVKDSKGCIGKITVTIIEASKLVVSASATKFTCSTTNTKQAAVVTIATPSTGTAPYEYSFNGGGYSSTINTLTVNDNGTDQVINYSVKDAKGCTASGSLTLNKLNPPVISSVTPTAVTCLATTSTVTVAVTGGTGVAPLVYTITAPASAVGNTTGASSGVFTGLASGTYTFKVTDANGCFATQSITVNPVTPIVVTASKLSDVQCKGDSTGSARYTISGFSATGNYSVAVTSTPTGLPYTTTTSGDVITLTGLSIGDYTLSVVDNTTKCPASATITILEPANPLTAGYATVNANCNVGTSKVTITAAGGTTAYKYAFVQNGVTVTDADFGPSNIAYLNPTTNLNWDVYVRDANKCEVMLDVVIAKDNAPTVTATAVNQCLGVGTYTITAAGTGTGTLQYSINGTSYQAGNTFTVTAAGTYNVWVKDANNCIAQTTTPVTVYPKLTIAAQLDRDNNCVSGSTSAKITLLAAGGDGSYTYSYTSTPVAAGTFAGNVFTTNAAADFTFTVTDSKGCTVTTTVPVTTTAPIPPDITGVTQTQFINCNGEQTAAITIAIDNTKGTSPFVFNVRRTSPTVQDYGTQTSGLAAGNYTVTITDAKGCTDTQTITINEPAKIIVTNHAVPITCVGGGTVKGSVIIDSVTGGTGPYNYYVTGINNYNASELNVAGTTSVNFNVVDFGMYQIRVVDSKGCTEVVSNVLVASPPNKLDISINSTATCTTGGTATITVNTAFTGVGPFHFNIYTGPGQTWTADGVGGWQGEMPAGSKSTVFNNLTPGVTYTFIVYDFDTKCYYYETAAAPIPTNSLLTVAATGQNITCTGAADGAVNFTITNPYPSATPITMGYEIFNAYNNVSTGISGTSPSVTTNYSVTNLGPLPKGIYYILVKELVGPNAGCSVTSKDFDILESPKPMVLTASVSQKANCANNSGIITALASFGTAPYTYQLLLASATAPTSGTAGWATPNTFNVNAGSYIVYAKDAYNCIKPFPIVLDKYTDPTINMPAPICYTGSPFTIAITGSVDATIVGGASYSVNGSTFQTSPNFTFNAPGTYNLVIKDGNGCTATKAYEVKPELQLDITLTKDLDCSATPAATITLSASGGFGPGYSYEYSTNGGTSWTTLASNVHQTSVTGNYLFRATDLGNTILGGCKVIKPFTLDPLTTIDFAVSSTNASCNGGSDGTITAVVSAGIAPFEYQLEDGATIVRAYQTSNEFKNLPAGTTYVVRVKDSKGCTVTKPVSIGQPSLIAATGTLTQGLTCGTGNSTQAAIVTINVTAGTGTSPYQYSFDGGLNYSSVNTYTTSASGTVTASVKDANGCIIAVPVSVLVPALDAPTDMDITGTPVYCLPVASQKSTVTIS
ncbi:DUF11 domain-containing protein, partial [Flavobacterium sp. LC2016-01]|uniref:DUF11 domain-containing protein n=1 Tax=Flavobacterium sp. LC2016-01 TaxID=2675876 RepID=UPI0018ACE5B4